MARVAPPGVIGLLGWALALPAPGAEDVFQTWMGMDYDRHLWMKTDACAASSREALLDAVPGMRRGGGSCAVAPGSDTSTFSAAFESHYRDLLRREGDSLSHFRHEDLTHALDLRWRPASFVVAQARLESASPRRKFQEGSIGFATAPSPDWLGRGALSLPFVPWMAPTASAGLGSDGLREFAFGLSGSASGFYWAYASGSRQRDLPSTLRLEDYRPFDFPLQLRRRFHAASAEWKGRRLELSGTARLRLDAHPEKPGRTYTVSDSGRSLEYLAGAAWSDSGAAGRWRAAIEGQGFEGDAVFRGLREREGGLFQFAYLDTRARNAGLRADLTLERGAWEYGVFAGLSALRWDAYRPAIPSGRYFWDRNAVADSYQGGIFDLFSRETWLFDGRVGLSTQSAGGWLARSAGAWRWRGGATWNHLDLEAHGLLTKRTSTLIIVSEERDYALDFHGLDAHLVTAELSLSRALGRRGARHASSAELSLAQALPLSARLRGGDGGSGEGRGLPSASDYSGGTEIRFRVQTSLSRAPWHPLRAFR